MAAAVNKGGDYILPVVFGDIEIPPELLNPHIHYLRAEDQTPDQVADQLEAKVNEAKNSKQPAPTIDEVARVVKLVLQGSA